MSAGATLRRATHRVLRSPAIGRALRSLARARGHRLVLVYHHVGLPAGAGPGVVPSVPLDVFRAQIRALAEATDVVTLDEILTHGAGPRPQVALTFDDDLPSHAEVTLPALRDVGVPATFFLSGRALHGLGAYWFQQLDALLAVHGEAGTAARLRLPGASAGQLAVACEGDRRLRRRIGELAADVAEPGVLDRAGIARLAGAGMTVGFHTVDHGIMPGMDADALDDAVTRGRDALAAVGGAPVRYFAYPHGKADARAADAVRRAGFAAAWTGRAEPLRAGAERFALGRWEPGPLAPEDLLARLALRFHRAAPPPREARA